MKTSFSFSNNHQAALTWVLSQVLPAVPSSHHWPMPALRREPHFSQPPAALPILQLGSASVTPTMRRRNSKSRSFSCSLKAALALEAWCSWLGPAGANSTCGNSGRVSKQFYPGTVATQKGTGDMHPHMPDCFLITG